MSEEEPTDKGSLLKGRLTQAEFDERAAKPLDVSGILEHAREEAQRAKARAAGPPKVSSGTCRLCGGEVKANFVRVTDRDPFGMRVGGPPRQGRWQLVDFSCIGCGLCYKFAPKPDTRLGS